MNILILFARNVLLQKVFPIKKIPMLQRASVSNRDIRLRKRNDHEFPAGASCWRIAIARLLPQLLPRKPLKNPQTVPRMSTSSPPPRPSSLLVLLAAAERSNRRAWAPLVPLLHLPNTAPSCPLPRHPIPPHSSLNRHLLPRRPCKPCTSPTKLPLPAPLWAPLSAAPPSPPPPPPYDPEAGPCSTGGARRLPRQSRRLLRASVTMIDANPRPWTRARR